MWRGHTWVIKRLTVPAVDAEGVLFRPTAAAPAPVPFASASGATEVSTLVARLPVVLLASAGL